MSEVNEHLAQIANYIQGQGLQPSLVEALKEALTYPGKDRPALVARIPVICNDIRDIKDKQNAMGNKQITMGNDIWWTKWLVMGMAGGIGVIFIAVVIYSITGHTKL